MPGEVSCRGVAAQDLPRIAALFERVYGRSYKYGTQAMGCLAEVDGDLVAHYGGISRRYLMNGREVLGIVAVDAMTAKEHRGRGVFARLVAYARERWRASGHAVVFGLPNSSWVARTQSLRPLPGARLERWQCHLQTARWLGRVGPAVDRAARHVRHYLSGRSGNTHIEEVAGPDARFDDLWTAARVDGAVRDRAWISARFASAPGRPYRIYTLGAPIQAYCVLRAREGEPQIGELADFHARDAAALRELVAAVVDLHRDQFVRIETHACTTREQHLALARAGFLVPRGGAPIHYSPLGEPAFAPPARCFFTAADFDLV